MNIKEPRRAFAASSFPAKVHNVLHGSYLGGSVKQTKERTARRNWSCFFGATHLEGGTGNWLPMAGWCYLVALTPNRSAIPSTPAPRSISEEGSGTGMVCDTINPLAGP